MASLTHFRSHSLAVSFPALYFWGFVYVWASVQCYCHLPIFCAISFFTARCAPSDIYIYSFLDRWSREKNIYKLGSKIYFISQQSSIQLTTGFACQNPVFVCCVFYFSLLAIIGTFSIFNGYDGVLHTFFVLW